MIAVSMSAAQLQLHHSISCIFLKMICDIFSQIYLFVSQNINKLAASFKLPLPKRMKEGMLYLRHSV